MVYKVTDTLSSQYKPLVVKVSEKTKIFSKEISAIKNIWKKTKESESDQAGLGKTPEVKAYGSLVILDTKKASI